MRTIATIICLLFSLSTVSMADETTDSLVRKNGEMLRRDVECGITAEFMLRNFNVFIAQIQATDPTGEDKTWLAAPIVKMFIGFEKDGEYHRSQLVSLGMTDADIDKMIEPIKDSMYSKYMTYYANSVNPAQAKAFLKELFGAQSSCRDWFINDVLPRLTQKENEIDG